VYVDPLNPVPIVSAAGFAAVIVPDPPRDIPTLLIVIALFANCALEIVPDKFVVGIVADAVAADAPFPYK
jgi:hypothetical protein